DGIRDFHVTGSDVCSSDLSNFDSYRERLTNFSNEFELGLFLHILRKNLYIVAIILCAALIGTYLYLRYTAPVYEARTIIQISNRSEERRVGKERRYRWCRY